MPFGRGGVLGQASLSAYGVSQLAESLARGRGAISARRNGTQAECRPDMSVPASASVALASSGRALTEQRPVSERAAKQVKFPVKLRPLTPIKPL